MKYHGGKRDGAGRRPVTHKKKRCNVTLAPDVLEILETLCNGNRSAAIEFVSRQWRSLTPREPDKRDSAAFQAVSNPKRLSTKKGLS